MSQTGTNNMRKAYPKFLESYFGVPTTLPKIEHHIRKYRANNDVVHDGMKRALKGLYVFLLEIWDAD
jgi:hypothetical protein